jgi:hypothetical protein
MKHRPWFALLTLLAAGAVAGEVYKWVDEAGHVQFGDQPPPGSDARPVEMHKVPTPAEVGRAKQRFDDRLEQARKRVLGPQAPEAGAPAISPPSGSPRTSQDAPCFAPLADFVQSPAGAAFAPVAPTLLDAGQRASLQALMRRAEGHWAGRIADVTCLGNPPAGEERRVELEVEDAAASWHPVDSMLVVDSQVAGAEQESQRLFIKFRVADALYFNAVESAGEIDLAGNKVELLSLEDERIAFVIKNRAAGAGKSRPLRSEVRYWEVSGNRVSFVELYFRNDLLSGSRTWLLTR